MEIKNINTENSSNKELQFETVILKLLDIVNTVNEVDEEMISYVNKIRALGVNSRIEAARIIAGENKRVLMAQKAGAFNVIAGKTEEQYKAMNESNLKLKTSLEYLAVCEIDINSTLGELFILDFDSSLKQQIPLLLEEIKLEFNNIVSFNQSIRVILKKIKFLSMNINISSDKLKNGNLVEDATFINFANELKEITEEIENSTGNMDIETKKIKELIYKLLLIINEIKNNLELNNQPQKKLTFK